jgi:hypothetical protein
MDFLTIHELSVEFDIPARVLRYRFLQLRQEAKLAEGVDYRRDDFVDDQHFVWKINPVSFMRKTGLKPVTKPRLWLTSLITRNHQWLPLLLTSQKNQGYNRPTVLTILITTHPMLVASVVTKRLPGTTTKCQGRPLNGK